MLILSWSYTTLIIIANVYQLKEATFVSSFTPNKWKEIRDFIFPSLEPASSDKKHAAKELIKALDLTKDPEDEEEKLKPNLTFNPSL